MKTLTLTVGISNCGKSTWAEEQLRLKGNKVVEINRDYYRYGVYKNLHAVNSPLAESGITTLVMDDFNSAVVNGQDIIINDTNLNARTRMMWERIAKEKGYQLEYAIFNSYFQETFFGSNSSKLMELPEHVLGMQYEWFLNFIDTPQDPTIIYTII